MLTRKLNIAIFTSLIILTNSNVFATNLTTDTQQRVIDYFNQSIPKLLTSKHIPGAAAIVVNNETILWQQGFGYRSQTNKQPVTPSTLFSVQSVSKIFTALGALVAAQQGLIKLDDPIQNYLPDFTVHSRFSTEPLAEMNFKHLLSHTAGFPHEAPVGNNFNPDSPSFAAHINSIQNVWLRYPVRQRYAYSNLGYDLVGYILEQQAKMSFANYIRNNVFAPIGMQNSTFDFEQIKRADNITLCPVPDAKAPIAIPMLPADGMYTNIIDLGKFLQFELNDGKVVGKQVLAKSYLDMMKQVPFPIPGQEVGYGLGVFSTKYGDTLVYGHNGGGFGFNGTVFWIPEYNIGMAILLNGYDMVGLNDMVEHLVKIIKGVKELPVNVVDKPVSANPGKKKFDPRWLGSYVTDNEDTIQLLFVLNELAIEQADKSAYVKYLGNNEFFAAENKTLYRYIPPTADQPAFIQRVIDGSTWDYNEGPEDRPGPNKPIWINYVGNYAIHSYKDKELRAVISVKNGYLYYNSYRLTEFKPGLFYAPNGYVLDLTGNTPIWNNAALLSKLKIEPKPKKLS